MPSNFEQLVFEIIATDRNASAAFDRFRAKVDQTSRSVDENSKTLDRSQGSFDKLGQSAARAAGPAGIAALIGAGGGGGMGGLGVAAVALAAPIVTLGTGLGGFGLAALAASKNTAQMAQVLAPLKSQFADFNKALQPQVLHVFNQGVVLAGHLLADIQPVAKATGVALGQALGAVDAEFQSGTWQNFFGFMARTAGPDLRLLTVSFINLADSLPPLIKLLQPTAMDLLTIAAATSKLVDASSTAAGALDKTGQHENFLAKTTDLLRTVLFAPGVGLYAALKLIGVVGATAAGGIATAGVATGGATPKFAGLSQTLAALSITWAGTPAKAAPATDAITRMAAASQAAFLKAGPATDAITRLGTNSRAAAGYVRPLTDAITMTAQNEQFAYKNAGPLTDVITRLAIPAKTAADRLVSVANAVKAINTQQSAALATANAYAGALVTTANDAHALEAALDASHDKIGLQTAAQRASFGAANTYITDLGNQATQAIAAGHGTDKAIAAIKDGLPILDQAKTKNKAYWQEVQSLVGWLRQLERLKAIHESVKVSGAGSWTVVTPGKIGLPGGTAGGPFPQAAGGLLRGGVPGKDSIPILAMPGEVIVPTNLVAAGVVDHLRGHLPGFAGGGLVPSYSGSVGGLAPWAAGNMNAQVHLFEQAVAAATWAGMHTAAASFTGGAGGPGGGAPAANAALARRMFPQWGSGPLWSAWNYVAMRESGWNQFARNPSSGAYGIPQALPESKLPFAGQAAGGSNPAAQIAWMAQYMSQRYGGPAGAAAHEAAFNWYDRGGWLYPGVTLAVNTTGRKERVLPPGRHGGAMVQFGDVHIHDGTDTSLLAQRLSFAVTAASLGS